MNKPLKLLPERIDLPNTSEDSHQRHLDSCYLHSILVVVRGKEHKNKGPKHSKINK